MPHRRERACQIRRQPPARMRDAAKFARSGVRRYPQELMGSLARLQPGVVTPALNLDAASTDSPLAAAWLGHATVLLRVGDRWVLTDPVFTDRIGVRIGPITVGLRRLMPPVSLESLPPIDVILLSHAHFDHLDRPTLRALVSDSTRIVTAKNTRRLIPAGFGAVEELGWEREIDVGGLRVRALRPHHWGARTAWDKHRGYNSYVISAPRGPSALFAGDTAFTDVYREASGVDLSIFGIGAYDPWIHAHANPEQAWEMHAMTGARHFLPMHHSTFKLSDEPLDEPLRRLRAVAGGDAPTIIGHELARLWVPGAPAVRG